MRVTGISEGMQELGGGEQGSGRVREVKNHKRLVSVNAVKSAVSAHRPSQKLGFLLSTETERQTSYVS